MKTIITAGGKYRTELDDRGLIKDVYRNDYLWNRNFIGDGYVLSLIQRIEELEDIVFGIKSETKGLSAEIDPNEDYANFNPPNPEAIALVEKLAEQLRTGGS